MKNRLLRILTVLLLLVILAIAVPAAPVQALQLVLSTYSGPPGTMVTVMGIGTGLGPSVYLSIYLGDREIEYLTSDTSGGINGTFRIPSDAVVGTYPVRLFRCVAATTPCTVELSLLPLINFVVTAPTSGTGTTGIATATVTPLQGIPGTPVTVNGTNFTPGASVRLYFNNLDTGMSRSVGDTGSVSIPYAPSQTEPGTYVIRLEDDSSTPQSASVNFQIIAELRAFIGKNNGAVGINQTVAGAGFKPNTAITIKYDSQEMTSAKTNTDAAGAFTTAFKIPVSAGGEHTITLTDGTNTKTFKFTMETTRPNAPALLSPVSNTVIDGPIFLDWSDVTDDSMPVTYVLQISPDPSFTASAVTLEKKDLKESRYTLSLAEQDKLTPIATATQPTPKDTKYYWTVQSVDGASNKGDWSMATAFIVPAPKATATAPAPASPTATPKPGATTSPGSGSGTSLPFNLPSWAVYALGVLIALLFLFIGIMLGRRSSY